VSSALLIGYCVAVGVQLLYLLLVFSRTAFYRVRLPEPGTRPGVSVVVCAWNEADNLRTLVPQLFAQQYPEFEVVVVNDRSTDETFALLHQFSQQYPALRVVHVDRTPAHVAAKKYALTLGIKAARHEVLLLTDADCRPASARWIERMADCLSTDKDLVLGISPYYKEPGLLNALIQFETFYTALQYISLALAGRPYMGVGRNLLYRRSFFLRHRGFERHYGILGGDDDLFVNRTATARNTAVCLHPDSFVYSFAKTRWAHWFTQKRRHLSVSSRYRRGSKILLGTLTLSQLAAWSFLVVLLALYGYQRDVPMLGLVLGVWLLRLAVQWYVYARANRTLAGMLSAGWVPVYDAFLTVYSVVMGTVMAFFRKKITWR
jgi:glycosyltransferase involved in cell wall biosynthesis